MDPRVEEILMARAIQDAADKPTPVEALAMGGAGGATLGALLSGRGKGFEKFGNRMAGGLVGAILGGGLGVGARNAMIGNSPAANMLAKAQTEGLTADDQRILQQIIADTYTQMGLR